MSQVINIGPYNNNYQLYQVKDKSRSGKDRYIRTTTYAVLNRDTDKFERYYQKQNKLMEDIEKHCTPENEKNNSMKLKMGAIVGATIGAVIPLSVFAFTKNKYARFASVIASVVGCAIGCMWGLSKAVMRIAFTKEHRKEFFKNAEEYKKLNVIQIKEEKQKIYEN